MNETARTRRQQIPDSATFGGTIVDINHTAGLISLQRVGTVTTSQWTVRKTVGLVRYICPAFVYSFRPDPKEPGRLLSWAPAAVATTADLARFLAYCGVANPNNLARKIRLDDFDRDPAGAVAARSKIETTTQQLIETYLPAGYRALAGHLFKWGATAGEIATVHAALIERGCKADDYINWLTANALQLAGDEDAGLHNFELLDALQHEASPKQRVIAAAQCALLRAETSYGHTIRPTRSVEAAIVKHTHLNADLVADTLSEATNTNHASRPAGGVTYQFDRLWLPRPDTVDKYTPWIARDVTSLRENMAAKGFAAVIKHKPSHRLDITRQPNNLNDRQREALESIATRPLTVIAGQAGTGKTEIIRHLAGELGADVAVTATTGAAAQAISTQATTLHSFLAVIPGMITSRRDKPIKVLVVDEASLLDVLLAAPLGNYLSTAGTGASRVVIVGDPYQAPPVGPGRILHDLITGETTSRYVIELDEIQRTERAGILELAGAIRRNGDPGTVTAHDGLDIIPVPADHHQAAAHLLATVNAIPADKRLIVTTQYGGPLGVHALNTALRDAALGEPPDLWIENQRVVQKVSQRIETPGQPDIIIANGTFGTITHISDTVDVTYDNGQTVKWQPGQCRPGQGVIESAYALTVHRAQGSQADNVFVVVDPDKPDMWEDPAIGYTAVTRAKRNLVVYGDLPTLFGQGTRQIDQRHTDLPRRIEAALKRKGN
ncbi:MAG: ATP-dependent DNA helicase [Acidimicrobiales bacterium]